MDAFGAQGAGGNGAADGFGFGGGFGSDSFADQAFGMGGGGFGSSGGSAGAASPSPMMDGAGVSGSYLDPASGFGAVSSSMGAAAAAASPSDFDDRNARDSAGKARPEEWSTADTAASDAHRKGRLGASYGTASSGLDFDSHGRVSEGFQGFDAPGNLGRRGRDPTPKTLESMRGDRRNDTGLFDAPPLGMTPVPVTQEEPSGSAAVETGPSQLGQLASVFEVTARLDATGEIRRLSREVLEERRQLEQQLSRRRDLERRLQEARGQMEALREERRRVEVESSASQRHAAYLQDELGFVEREVRDAEEDLRTLRESGDLSRMRRGPAPYSSPEEEQRDVLSKVRSEKELLQRDQRAIEELRLKLEEVFKQKLDAQALQQALLEKQRQSEQDRGLMLTAIESERGKLSAMRAERIRMWEERSALEREMTDIMQERWLAEHRTPVRTTRADPDQRDGDRMGVPIGVPSDDNFQSAPAEMQRRAPGPGGLGGLLRHTGDGQYRTAGSELGGLGGLLRHTGDGQYRGGGETSRSQGEALFPSTLSNSGPASGLDSRGLRNEEITPSFGGGAFSAGPTGSFGSGAVGGGFGGTFSNGSGNGGGGFGNGGFGSGGFGASGGFGGSPMGSGFGGSSGPSGFGT